MIPNNNLSVLPWYTSIEQQNARKWWVYDRVYPLFTPAGFILPFQIMREHAVNITPGVALVADDPYQGHILAGGTVEDDEETRNIITEYQIPGILEAVYFRSIPKPDSELYVSAVALDQNGNVLGVFRPEYTTLPGGGESYIGGWLLPNGTHKICVQTSAQSQPGVAGSADRGHVSLREIESVEIYTRTGELVGNITMEMRNAITIKAFAGFGYDVIVFPGQVPIFQQFENGQYYMKMSDGLNTWYSEVFTVVNDIQPYLKITWWDTEDFVMDAGTIVYTEPAFKNVVYIQSNIAKPEYPFEEEGENRDGYFFPTKQISEKRYKFNFLASEYLLDVMRFIRMADFTEIEYNGKRYILDTFLISPEWEDNGDVATVEAEFDTATVAKKIGFGYTKSQRGDFNDDFNNDFN